MKYLSNYTEAKTTKALDEAGAFFAFGKKQFDEQKKEHVEYVSMGMGLVCPKANADTLARDLLRIGNEGRAEDLAENGKRGVIHRELGNHEYCVTYDITDTAMSLCGYGITDEEIQAETGAYLKAHYEWEDAQERAAVTA